MSRQVKRTGAERFNGLAVRTRFCGVEKTLRQAQTVVLHVVFAAIV